LVQVIVAAEPTVRDAPLLTWVVAVLDSGASARTSPAQFGYRWMAPTRSPALKSSLSSSIVSLLGVTFTWRIEVEKYPVSCHEPPE
jgi:hypothetical protein